MHSQLRERIRLMRARLDNAAPVAEIRAESQLFVTPAPVCDRLVTLAEISNRDHILEPSAGTGAILRAIRDTAPEAMCDAVEINSGLVRYREIITPFLVRRFFPDVLCLSSGCAGRSGTVTGVVSLAARG